jgi:hypothetical protein
VETTDKYEAGIHVELVHEAILRQSLSRRIDLIPGINPELVPEAMLAQKYEQTDRYDVRINPELVRPTTCE